MSIEFPSDAVPLNSIFYIERPPLEELAYTEIEKLGSLIRIKAPRKMGKSSLLIRLLNHAKNKGYHIISIDFQEADSGIYHNLDKFLRWLCCKMALSLKLPPLLDNYWDDDMGSKLSSSNYLQAYILEKTQNPIVLAFNEVNLIFEYPTLAKDFLALLRFWYEQARQVDEFAKLRLVVVHSTEIYVPLNINQSPFNIGLPIELPLFNIEQIETLAQRHGLHWSTEQALQLGMMTGGHPYLVRLALYHLQQGQLTLEQLLEEAPTQTGIYKNHLQHNWDTLQQQPQLLAAIQKLATATESLQLEPIIAYKLYSMGLIKIQRDRATISCELYRLYFNHQCLDDNSLNHYRLQQLEQENKALKKLVNIDSLTKIANRRYFDTYLEQEWKRASRDQVFISLILLDIDYFKLYNDTYGHQQGDYCLQEVAKAINQCLKRPGDLVARYGGEEFAIILPQTDGLGAISIAQKIKTSINDLQLEHSASKINIKTVTVSMGIVSIIPQINCHCSYQLGALIRTADQALYTSKEKGRNQINISKLL